MATKVQIFEERKSRVSSVLAGQINRANADLLAEQILRGAEGGSEFGDFDEWLSNRFEPQLVWLSNDDYTRAITRALPQALKFAAADFGSTRQRDLGQLWTDTARGFLGEIAFQRFLKERYDKLIEQDTSTDKARDEYISTDIKAVSEMRGTYEAMRPPKINVSIKTGKFNARWMDEYSAKKTESIDTFVFVRVGTAREHFVAFLKAISFLGTKLFPAAEQLGELTAESRQQLWDTIPEFEPVPAYISGFLTRAQLTLPIHDLQVKIAGKKNQRIIIIRGVGNFSQEVLRGDDRIKSIDPESRLPIVIDGIESEISDSPHFYANTGALKFGVENWRLFIDAL